jgi:hypothetical protein
MEYTIPVLAGYDISAAAEFTCQNVIRMRLKQEVTLSHGNAQMCLVKRFTIDNFEVYVHPCQADCRVAER